MRQSIFIGFQLIFVKVLGVFVHYDLVTKITLQNHNNLEGYSQSIPLLFGMKF